MSTTCSLPHLGLTQILTSSTRKASSASPSVLPVERDWASFAAIIDSFRKDFRGQLTRAHNML